VNVLPIYLVLEESEAMKGARLDAVNSALPHIHYAVARDPIVNDKVRFGVISFSDTAEVLVPLTQLAQLQHLPGLVPKGGINYTAAFTLVKTCIQTDVDALKVQSFQVLRPFVFLVVSNDTPLDDWRDSHQALTGEAFIYRPHIVAFGFDIVEPDHIRSLATLIGRGEVRKRFAFGLKSSNVDSGLFLWDFLREIVKDLVQAKVFSNRNPPPLPLPPALPDGVTDFTADGPVDPK
jgi:uncharacterized protein YegL